MHEMLGERNHLVTLLQDRIRLVRRAARYVFRSHPELAQKFSSAYERNRRRALRRRKQAEPANATTEEVPTQSTAAAE